MRQIKINETFQKIHELGSTLDATKANKNRGMLHLLKDGVRIHSESFSTNGRGTTRVRATLPTSYRLSHTGKAMNALLEWIEDLKFDVAPYSADPYPHWHVEVMSTVQAPGVAEYFTDKYNTFAPIAFSKVKEAAQSNPKLSFEQLFSIWSVELQFLLKTHNKNGGCHE